MPFMTIAGLHLALRRIGNTVDHAGLQQAEYGLRFCLTDCAEWIHQDNRERGWWTDLHTGRPLQRNVGELLMLMVSELAEVPSEVPSFVPQTMDDKLPERLMFEVELADCAIRIFDTAGALAPNFQNGYISGCEAPDDAVTAVSIDEHLMMTVRILSQAMEHHRKNVTGRDGTPVFDYDLGRALHSVFYTAKAFGLNVADAMIDKLEYNRKRADHQPENRKAAGGKAY